MPLERGTSRQTVSDNIREMRKAGYPEDQAVAASLSQARRAGRRGGRRQTRRRGRS